MSVKTVPGFVVACDRCGKTTGDLPGSEYSMWTDETGALEDAVGSDFEEIGEKHACPDCWQWDDEGEEIIFKPAQTEENPMTDLTHIEKLEARCKRLEAALRELAGVAHGMELPPRKQIERIREIARRALTEENPDA